MNPADKRLSELLDKWLTSLELHLKYSALDDESYWKVQPWVAHDRPSRWIIELAKQKAEQLKEQLDTRVGMGDAKFSDSLELMAFLTNLVGSQHIARFIPLAEPQNEVDLEAATASSSASVAIGDSTRVATLATQPRRALVETTREMPRPAVIAEAPEPPQPEQAKQLPPAPGAPESVHPPRRAVPRGESRKSAARRDGRSGHAGSAAKPRGESHASNHGRELKVVADAVRLLGWGRKWHELPELISRMADRPPVTEVRRILRDNKEAIDQQSEQE